MNLSFGGTLDFEGVSSFELLSCLDLDLERLFAPPFTLTFDLEHTFESFVLGDSECDRDLECLLVLGDLVVESMFERLIGDIECDSERDTDLEYLLFLVFEVTFERFLGDTEHVGDLLLFRGDLECLSFLVLELTLALNFGDTERDGDLKCLLLLVLEVTLERYPGDTEHDGDLECLSFLVLELTLPLNLGDTEHDGDP